MKSKPPNIKRKHLHDIRINNRSRILQILRDSETISRQELAECLGLTPASLSRISRELIAQGICVEAPISREGNQRGRPSVALRINAKVGYLVAISISSYSRLISIVDISGERHHQQDIPKHIIKSAAATVAFVGDYVDGLLTEGRLEPRRIIGAALAIPGSINAQTGFLTKSVFLEWPNFPIREKFAARLGCPVRLENIGDALCLHHLDNRLALGKPNPSVFLAHVSAGMGASIAIGGRIVRRLADEGWINDIIVPPTHANGVSNAKLSQFASGRAILAKMPDFDQVILEREADFNQRLQSAVTISNETEREIGDVFYEAGQVLGRNLVPLTIAIAPDTIVLAGPVLRAQAYSDGVKAGYLHAAREMDIHPSNVVVSGAKYIDASENLALHEFFFSGAYGS